MDIVNPFEQTGKWFRANLHCHTTTSDGDCTVAERVDQYREQGYAVLAITDHRLTNDVEGLSSEGFLVISGMETHPDCPGEGDPYHIVCLNVPYGFSIPEGTDADGHIGRVKDAGGELIIAHPYWCGHTLKHLLPLRDVVGVEVYNSTCGKIGKAFSSVHWDNMLAEGVILPASACDDTHGGRDRFMGWTMIKAESLTLDAVMASIRTGCYYASCGPVIEDFRIADGKAVVRSSPVAEVHFISRSMHGHSVYTDDGEDVVEAEMELYEGLPYVRCEVIDRAGNHAWTNPIVLQ